MKNWTDEEKIKLYNYYTKIGPNWKKIGEFFGVAPECARSLFRRTNFEKIIKTISEIKKEEEIKDENLEDITSNLLVEKKEKLVNMMENRRVREHLENLAKQDLIYNKIISAINKVPNISLKNINIIKAKSKLSPQESVLLISDCHIGLAVVPEEVGGLGNYDVKTFNRRVKNLTQTVCDLTDTHRSNHELNTINILFLGDIVHGGNDSGQWGFLHQEQNVIDQVFEACQKFQIMILELRKVYPKVNIHAVYGNHGRVGHKGFEKKFVNWDYLIYKWIEASLCMQDGITFNVPRSFFDIAEIMGKKILIMHGHQAKSWAGIPWYGINRIESKMRNLIDRSKNAKKMWELIDKNSINKENPNELAKFIFNYMRSFDFLALGHFHSLGEIETISGSRVILNSSFVGGDDYSINDLLSANEPCQKFFGINEDRKTWSYDIELER